MTNEPKSFLQTHPTIRKIVIGVSALLAIAAGVFMFGDDRMWSLIVAAARFAGIEIAN